MEILENPLGLEIADESGKSPLHEGLFHPHFPSADVYLFSIQIS